MHNWPKSGYVRSIKTTIYRISSLASWLQYLTIDYQPHFVGGGVWSLYWKRSQDRWFRSHSVGMGVSSHSGIAVSTTSNSSLALRLLAFGVVITCEGLYICSELAPFEQHPIVRRVLSEPELLKRRRRRAKLLEGWGKATETATIGRAAHLIGKAYCPSIFREKLSDILKQPLPTVSKYSLDGGRTWRWLAMESPRPMLDDVRVA